MFSLGCSCGRRQTEEEPRYGDCFSYVVSIDGVHVCHPKNIVEYEDVGIGEGENDSLALDVCCEKSTEIDGVDVCLSRDVVEDEDEDGGEEESENDELALVRCEKSAEAAKPACVDPRSLLQRRGISFSRVRLAALLSSTESTVVNSLGGSVTEPAIITNRPGPKNRKYEFIKQIGADGEGVIDLVKERKAPRLVVRKTVGYARSWNAKPIEAAILQDILPGRHDNIIRLHAFEPYGPEGALYFFEFCSGGDLHQLVDQYRDHDAYLPEPFIWQVYQQMASALAFLHQGFDPRRSDRERRGVCHRDIKPSNIFLRPSTIPNSPYPDCVLADFGHATLDFATYDPAGTALWQAPELPRHSPRGDVYSLGAVIHFLIHFDAPIAEMPDGYLDTDSQRAAWVEAPEARKPIMAFVKEYSERLVCMMLIALEPCESRRKNASQLLKCVDECVAVMFPSGSLSKAAEAWPMARWAFDHTLFGRGTYEEDAGTEQYFEMMDRLWCGGSRESSLSSSRA